MRIIVNSFYIYQNNLVQVVGAATGTNNPGNMRFMIQWGDSQGRACSAEVARNELEAAPTMPRLYYDYRQALDVICQQAHKIEELEARIEEWE